MKKITLIIVSCAVSCALLPSCRTTESNYRAAYEKVMAGRGNSMDFDSTVYGNVRREIQKTTVKAPDGPEVEVRRQFVKVTPEGGGTPGSLQRYCVVVGQFKQVFNARSLRERIADAGYPETFIVQTSEPYYYIVLTSTSGMKEALDVLADFRKKEVIPMREPVPFILDATAAGKTMP